MTATHFFRDVAPGALSTLSASLRGRYRFDIAGAGTWVIDFDNREVSEGEAPAQHLIRAADGDFTALLEGRLSVSDALLTERLRVTGDVAQLLVLAEALQTFAGNP